MFSYLPCYNQKFRVERKETFLEEVSIDGGLGFLWACGCEVGDGFMRVDDLRIDKFLKDFELKLHF